MRADCLDVCDAWRTVRASEPECHGASGGTCGRHLATHRRLMLNRTVCDAIELLSGVASI